jgi:hypothetical protein
MGGETRAGSRVLCPSLWLDFKQHFNVSAKFSVTPLLSFMKIRQDILHLLHFSNLSANLLGCSQAYELQYDLL